MTCIQIIAQTQYLICGHDVSYTYQFQPKGITDD